MLRNYNPFYTQPSSLDCRLWRWHIFLLESVLLLAECCESFWRGFSDHPPLLSFVDIQAFLCCWAHQCVSFLRMYQTVELATPNVPAISLMDLICFWSLTIVFHLHGELFWLHDVGSQQQLPNANLRCILRINSRTFTCLIDTSVQ